MSLVIDTLPDVCFMKVISFLDAKSINNILDYLEKFNKIKYQSLKYRLNLIIRTKYPILRLTEYTHENIEGIRTRQEFMMIYSRIFNEIKSYGRESLDLYTCFSIITNNLISKYPLDSRNTKKFRDVTTINSTYFKTCPKSKNIKLKIDGRSCYIDIKNLDDYLSLGIDYKNLP